MKAYSLFRTDSGSGNFPPPPPPPQYNAPPPPVSPNTGGGASSNAVIALVLGILSFIACGLFAAIPAWIIGKKELNEIDSGRSSESGRTLAKIGMWLGIVNVILSILGFIIVAILFALGLLGNIFNQ
ncbi:MAG: DUF4190 domain-containing protein [Bacteroidota bacterium]|nr:DUF4190 domain-containing protein [Bacteroidota bacterium]